MSYYHYCSTEAFFQIIKNKSIWLSSLTSSNDSMEGKWLANVLAAICDEDGVAASDKDSLIRTVGLVEDLIDCLGFCMSEEDDALSQWRGYADDGAGICVKFSSDFVETFKEGAAGVYLRPVIYDPAAQRKLLRYQFTKIEDLISNGAFRRPFRGTILSPKSEEQYGREQSAYRAKNAELFGVVMEMPYFAMKNPAFSEEREWRLTSPILRPVHDGLEFRMRGARIVPYREIAFPEAVTSPIAEVVLGPKNPTPVAVMNVFLARHGLNDVKVRVSSASYR